MKADCIWKLVLSLFTEFKGAATVDSMDICKESFR